MENYIIITWKDGQLVGLDNDVTKPDAYQRMCAEMEDHEGDYAIMYRVDPDGSITQIDRMQY